MIQVLMIGWSSGFSKETSHTEDQLDKSLVLGISSSGTSKDIIRALEHANLKGMQMMDYLLSI